MIVVTDAPKGLGYLQIDHRWIHGHPPEGMPALFECDTYTCRHCERIVVMNPKRVRVRYKCLDCNHHICDECAAAAYAGKDCKPYRQMVAEHMERMVKGS